MSGGEVEGGNGEEDAGGDGGDGVGGEGVGGTGEGDDAASPRWYWARSGGHDGSGCDCGVDGGCDGCGVCGRWWLWGEVEEVSAMGVSFTGSSRN